MVIVWIMGVRESGTAIPSRMLPRAFFLNFTLPLVARSFDGIKVSVGAYPSGTIPLFGETPKLNDPGRTLKTSASANQSFYGSDQSGVRVDVVIRQRNPDFFFGKPILQTMKARYAKDTFEVE